MAENWAKAINNIDLQYIKVLISDETIVTDESLSVV